MIGLFIVREEGGMWEPVGLLSWLTSDAPIWGVKLARTRLIYDTILKRLGYSPWRVRHDPPPLVERLNFNTGRWESGFE